MRHAGMNNFMAIDIPTLTNRKSYGHVGNDFISEKKKKKARMRSFIPTIWKMAPSALPKVIVGVELKYVMDYFKLLWLMHSIHFLNWEF